MSTITQVRFWNDCGFTENCLEVPSKSNELPSPTLTLSDDLNVSVDRMFSQLKLRQSYSTLMNVSYLEATYEMNNGSDLTIYGWVDSVSMQSDTSGFPMTVVDWHIDYWRTYLNQASFGSGMVRRRPMYDLMTDVPPQSYPHRFITWNATISLATSNIWWVFVYYTSVHEQTTYLRWGCYPVNRNSWNSTLSISVGGQNYNAPSVSQTASGQFDELIGLDPESIFFACISPYAPNTYTGTGTSGSPIVLNNWGADPALTFTNSAMFSGGFNGFFTSESGTFAEEQMTDDTNIYVITGFNGEVVGALPWGMAFSTYQRRLIPSATSMVIEYRFLPDNANKSQIQGMTFDIPCPTIDIGSNAWSSYVYSGSRQAEMDQRQLQAESQAVSGGISAGTSAISGAVTGALLGSAAGPVGMLGGALIGAVASAGTSLISTGANYAYQTGSYADEMQTISDYKASHQTSSVLVSGSGWDALVNGIEGPNLVRYTYDEYSLTQRENDLELYGYAVSEPMESCQGRVDIGGPLQITNLTVGGDIPVEAKQFFRTRFSKGVRMIPYTISDDTVSEVSDDS